MRFDEPYRMWLEIVPFVGEFWIAVPDFFKGKPLTDCMLDKWGFSWDWRTDRRFEDIRLHWGYHCKFIYMPWDWKHYRTDKLMADGTWWRSDFYLNHKRGIKWIDNYRKEDTLDLFKEVYDYNYKLRKGEIQKRTATIGVEEWEWRWRWFMRLPFPRMIRKSITVEFSDEVGERSGSWKGGCIGCGYHMKEFETPKDTLKRMEREREFR